MFWALFQIRAVEWLVGWFLFLLVVVVYFKHLVGRWFTGSRWNFTKMQTFFFFSPLFHHQGLLVSLCPSAPLTKCSGVQVSQCPTHMDGTEKRTGVDRETHKWEGDGQMHIFWDGQTHTHTDVHI